MLATCDHHSSGRVASAALVCLGIALAGDAVRSQERSLCVAGAPGAPSVYIDSSASEVTVLTADGRQLIASRDLLLCPGDEVRTGATGRVAIRFEEKRTLVRLDGNSRTRVLSGGTGSADVSLLSGVLYFISSVRRHFEVDTPYIVAGIDGTEALIGVQPAQSLAIAAVREGRVSAYDRQYRQEGILVVPAGEAAFRSPAVGFRSAPIGALPPPFRDLLVVSDSAVDWAVYYPPILLVRHTENEAVRDAIVLLSSGDYEQAAAALDVGASAEPAATAALRAIIAVARNRVAEAEVWSARALQAEPGFAPAHVAASYVRQAAGDLEGALEFARAATRGAPHDAYAVARFAELQMTIGDRRAALATAEQSLTIERTPLALFVAGLARLSAWQYEEAETLFREAIAFDPEAPLPRLGLGLVFIRQGRTTAGAWEIERAVAHDPRRAILRTWLGRAYFDEELTAKAAEQLRIAKAEDPNDPTPFLFSAIERYAANRPIEALRDLQEAEKRGGARRVIRSERGLAEDTAARGAALGRIYDVLGFEQLAVVEGAKATEADPSNPAAHRFLAGAYRQRPGYEIAQASELLRSQLLSPPSKTPVQPQLAETDLALLDTTGPSRVTFAEFSPLFDGDGFRLDASGLLGTQSTWGDEIAVTALYRGASVSVGQFHYETDGYRPNNDLTHDIFNAVGTFALSPEFSAFGEYRFRQSEGGDRRIDFIDSFLNTLRGEREHELARAGFHSQPTVDSDLIAVYTWANLQTRDEVVGFGGGLDTQQREDDSHGIQAQHIWQPGVAKNIAGAAYTRNDVHDEFSIGSHEASDDFSTDYLSAYDYFYFDFPDRVSWTLGGALVSFDTEDVGPDNSRFDVLEFLPKIGVSANPFDKLTLRAAYLQSLKPDRVSDQVIEPTTVAGFNQFYDSFNTSILEQLGGGVDIELGDGLFIGAEALRRWWHVPLVGEADPETEERVYRAYAYATLTDQLALAAELVDERSTSDLILEGDFAEWRTTSVPVTLSYFSPSGFFGAFGGEFVDHSFDDSDGTRSDRFMLFNASAGYRFPANRGVMSIEAKNLFDEQFQYQNRGEPLYITARPRYAPERVIQVRGTLRF
jgi:tetratricopeptide (TPR) repeat protein